MFDLKHIPLYSVLLFIFSCKAQSTTVPIYNSTDYGEDSKYYKDIDNNYDTFEGTWIYGNGNDSLKIILTKKELLHIEDTFSNYYTDALVGEYKYIENGIEKINTLDNLNVDVANYYNYNIFGGTISKYGDPLCEECELGDTKVKGSFSDPTCEIYGFFPIITLRHFMENNVEKLHIKIYGSGTLTKGPNGEESQCTEYKVPFGEYILTKQ